ncbi:2-C-methyl-D-erythritol 4-phosphate cytidylyltransferase [Cryobacterium psychrophilum]|uniref:Bifunctional enzyme IspD/IspF n=1 Tax=Cryobacterium psychrophilum TaxID=41988 RepID=A0A4Y8KVM4_9MICO|nr:2-C-methyl-D-erythritol 4-phosphate cytidylyltransferase [Cryobacterium psychrophilum]TDW29533.1 2-C-methyl-D-erythritol 2,4-cyclodiphosphate synthase [Cryobacterium psychrophilum]TFD81670.1 2-C-methyl-D-erythritol 4-phosphate cytidylyltransferase [Cryobacterium psychrophilum]
MTETPAPTVGVIVVAAGSGTRLGRSHPKAFVHLQGRTLLEHALLGVFGMSEAVQVIVVAPEDRVGEARAVAADASAAREALGPVSVVAGGTTRQQSVDRGLAALDAEVEIVLVHDAARALTPSDLCDRVVAAVRATGAGVIPGLAVVDTIKRVDASDLILDTVDRAELSAVQTPQGFPRAVLVAAHDTLADEATDDAALVAAAGHAVRVIEGSPLAFKITTPNDLERAGLLLAPAPGAIIVPRIGTGLDVHAFSDTAELWLAGLNWPGERGLSGHSDGDVAVHAVCDALLGAAGLGDIGGIFGTSDARFAGAHGDVFLTETLRLVAEAGFAVGNVSVQIIGNRPRFAPRRGEAEALLAGLLQAPVNIAATTTDALGFTGRGEGIAATATALLVPRAPLTRPTVMRPVLSLDV